MVNTVYVPDAVAWAASNVVDDDLAGALADGNAVVPGSDDAVDHMDVVRRADVGTVCVRAVPGGSDLHIVHGDIAAVGDVVMEVLAVQGCDPFDKSILHFHEFYVLHPQQTDIFIIKICLGPFTMKIS